MTNASIHLPDTNHCGLHESEQRWFAVYTPYKREKSAVRELNRAGITAYTPLLSKHYQYKRKTVVRQLPLMNHYVFVKIRKAEYKNVLEARDVSFFINFSGNLVAIPNDEILILQRIVGEFEDVCANDFDPQMGQRVEIIHGKLTGLAGYIIQEHSKDQFIVDLEHIGVSLRVHVNRKMLNPL